MSPQFSRSRAQGVADARGDHRGGPAPLIPDLIAQTRPTVQDMIYVFIGGAAGGFVKRFLGEGLYDSKRAETGDTIPADVTKTPAT
jgi:flavin-dependent dehydrogenase